MPTLLHKDFGLVKGVGFDSSRRVGSAVQAIRVYELREVDELVFLDIAATPSERAPAFDEIDELADDCFMPLTVGGGVRTPDHIARLLSVGADKVVLTTGALLNPDLIDSGAANHGSQAIVVGIDVRRNADGNPEVWSHCGHHRDGRDPVPWARDAEARGAGEILLTSIDRDGTQLGYDIPLIRAVADAVSIPVIASGGAGAYSHMAEALTEGRASAVAAASMFHFTEQTPRGAKMYLRNLGLPVRL